MEFEHILQEPIPEAPSYNVDELFASNPIAPLSTDYAAEIEIDSIMAQLAILGKAEKALVRFQSLDKESFTQSDLELEERALSSAMGVAFTPEMRKDKDGLLTKIRKGASNLLDRFFKFIKRIFKKLFGIESKQEKKVEQQVKQFEMVEAIAKNDAPRETTIKIEKKFSAGTADKIYYTGPELAFIATGGTLIETSFLSFLNNDAAILKDLDDEFLDLRGKEPSSQDVQGFLILPRWPKHRIYVTLKTNLETLYTRVHMEQTKDSLRPLDYEIAFPVIKFVPGPKDPNAGSKHKVEKEKMADMGTRYKEAIAEYKRSKNFDTTTYVVEEMEKDTATRMANLSDQAEIEELSNIIKACTDVYLAYTRYAIECRNGALSLGDKILKEHVLDVIKTKQ